MRIRTKYKTNAKGTGQIVARTAERQKTITLDHARTNAQNHGDAAGELILANAHEAITEWQISKERLENATAKPNEAGTEFVFEV